MCVAFILVKPFSVPRTDFAATHITNYSDSYYFYRITRIIFCVVNFSCYL